MDSTAPTTVTPTPAEEIRARRRFTHTAASGTVYRFRRLNVMALIERGIAPPGLIASTKEEREQAADEFTEALAASGTARLTLIREIVTAAVESPRIWSGADDACPADHITYDDVDDDAIDLFVDIMDKSGYSARVVRAATFPDGEPGVGAPAVEGGEPASAIAAPDDADVAGGVGA